MKIIDPGSKKELKSELLPETITGFVCKCSCDGAPPPQPIKEGKMASLQDALTNVRCLQDFSLPDEQPTIEPEPTSIVYQVSFDTNFADRTAFITGSGRYNEEATICSSLVRQCEEFFLFSSSFDHIVSSICPE